MIWGKPGIGKTDIVKTYAAARGRRLVALHLPQFDPVDIKGIPIRFPDGTVKWVPSSYLPQMRTVLVNANNIKHEIKLPWKYAEDLQILVYNEANELVFSENDGDVPNFDTAEFSANVHWEYNGEEWVVSVLVKNELPEHKTYRVVIADKAVIFLDELSAADPATQNAALQLVLDKRINEYEVPYNVPMIGAGNGEGDGAFVQGMSLPLANRFGHFTLVEDLEDWLAWAMYAGISPAIWGYIKWRGKSALMDFNPETITNEEYGFRTPRSWASFSAQLMSGKKGEGLRSLPDNCVNAVATGFIGRIGATEFKAYLDTHDLLPDTDDVLDGKIIEIDEKVRKSHMWGFVVALGQKLKDRYDKYYDKTKGAKGQCKEWNDTAANVIYFINHGLEGDIASFFLYLVTVVYEIRAATFNQANPPEFDRFTDRYGLVFARAVKAR